MGIAVITVSDISQEELARLAQEHDLILPIEQSAAWIAYEATIPGRTPWGGARLDEDGELLGIVFFVDYETHGYHFLRAHHAPVWTRDLDASEEEQALSALASYVRSRDRKQVFLRLAVEHELAMSRPTLSTRPYDSTVVIDVTGTEDDIMSRMKPRGRRDVRKALRESPAIYADETDLAVRDFSDYYDVMRETAARDGFTPAPMSDYQDMVSLLGPEHCRVFAGRIDGRVVTFSIVTVEGKLAMRYYAGSRNNTMRLHVTDALVYFECCELGKLGCERYDLMAIGSDICPELMGLNEFKTKFTREVTHVAPDRDVPLRKGFYATLVQMRKVIQARRERARAKGADAR